MMKKTTTTDTHAAFENRPNFSDIMTTPTFSGPAYRFGTRPNCNPPFSAHDHDCSLNVFARLDCQRPPIVSDDERQEVDVAHGARERKGRKHAADQAGQQIAEPIELDAERDCGQRQ